MRTIVLRKLAIDDGSTASFANFNVVFCRKCEQGRKAKGAYRDIKDGTDIYCQTCSEELKTDDSVNLRFAEAAT